MADIALQAQVRTVTGKRVRRLRQQGLVPGNIYGRGVESVAVQLDVRALRDVLIHAGSTTVVDVHVGSGAESDAGKAHPVLIEHVSRHPTSGIVLHVDLRQVDLNRPVRAAVPIVLGGEAPAVDQGGVLVQSLDTLEVEALPRSLPHEIQVDLTGLAEIDAQIAAGDVQLPEGVTIVTDPETVIVRVVASRLEQEVAAEEEATAAALAEVAETAEPAEAEEAAEGAEPAASEESGESRPADRG